MEIKIYHSQGIFLTSLLLTKYVLSSKQKMFQNYDFFWDVKNEKIKKMIESMQKEKIDIETLYFLALTYEGEYKDEVFKALAKTKPTLELPKIRDSFVEGLSLFSNEIPFDLKRVFENETLKNTDAWFDIMPSLQKKFIKINDFFKSSNLISTIKVLAYNPFLKKEEGRAFFFENEIIINSSIENEKNIFHEYLHGIINPIVDKIELQLTKEKKEEMLNMANYQLKEDYGYDFKSVFAETLIRTYNDYYIENKEYQDFGGFSLNLDEITKKDFYEKVKTSSKLKGYCDERKIRNKQDFLNFKEEYYEKFIKNELGEKCLEIYDDYRDQNEKFNDFLTNKLINEKTIIK